MFFFRIFVKKRVAMTTITINERTTKGKSLLAFLRKFEGEGFILIEKEPTASLLEAIEEAKTGKTKEIKDVGAYFNKVRKKANV